MIRSITSDLGSFKSLNFHGGLNILLADKSEGATDKQSRNGAGKSSFVDVVHFLLGSNAGSDSIFKTEALKDYYFYIDFDLAGQATIVGRSGNKSNEIRIIHSGASDWRHQPKVQKATNQVVLSNTQWREVLGQTMFGISPSDETYHSRFEPSFRQLFAYFARRQSSGAFHDPLSQSKKQQEWDIQLAITYLIGLDWTVPKKFQEVRTKEKTIRELRKAVKEGGITDFLSTAAELRTRVTVTEAKVRKLQYELEEFRVVPEYSTLEREANEHTARLGLLSDENTTDRALILSLNKSLLQEEAPGVSQLETMYTEAGIVLPDKVTKRFDEVIHFHQAIVDNRRAHLRSEIEQAEQRIQDREREMNRLDSRRSQIMNILKAGGALEHYTRMQEELGRTEAEAETLRKSLMLAEELESRRTTASIERKQLYQLLQQDHHEQADKINRAILTFEELSTALYERAGSLQIYPGENGPKYDVRIEGARSRGITNMQIYCFDMMLMILNGWRSSGPGFLIHDSHLFDGVDERQVAKALELGSENASRYGFQYIVTMNSDAMPQEGFSDEFDIDSYIIEPRLTDKTDTGGLFGLRFS